MKSGCAIRYQDALLGDTMRTDEEFFKFDCHCSLKKYKKLPSYKLISNTGPRHKPIFKVGVKLQTSKFYVGEGASKKDAEQNAAILCLNEVIKS